MIWTTHHMGLSVRGALWNNAYRRGQSSLLGSVTNPETGKKLTSEEIFDSLCDALENGQQVLPMGECDDWDPVTGCRGHGRDDEANKIIHPGRHAPWFSRSEDCHGFDEDGYEDLNGDHYGVEDDIHPFWKMTVVSFCVFVVLAVIGIPIAALLWILSFVF